MKDLSLIMEEVINEFFACLICKSSENQLTFIEPCNHNFCYFCLDIWIKNNNKCSECKEYITYIYFNDKKIHINQWDDIKNNIFIMVKDYLERKVVVRKILEQRIDKLNENNEYTSELLDPHIPESQKKAIQEQINVNLKDIDALLELSRRQEFFSIEDLKKSIFDEDLDDIENSMNSVFEVLIQQCFVLGQTDINSIVLYIMNSINEYLNNITNFIII